MTTKGPFQSIEDRLHRLEATNWIGRLLYRPQADGTDGDGSTNLAETPTNPARNPESVKKGTGCCLLLGFPRGDSDEAGDDSGWDFDDD